MKDQLASWEQWRSSFHSIWMEIRTFEQLLSHYEFLLLVVTGGMVSLGILLLFTGGIGLLLAQKPSSSTPNTGKPETVVLSRKHGRPLSWQASVSYVREVTWSRQANEEFTSEALQEAWRTGIWRQEALWRRRMALVVGLFLTVFGAFGLAFVLGSGPVKLFAGGALLYVVKVLRQDFSSHKSPESALRNQQ